MEKGSHLIEFDKGEVGFVIFNANGHDELLLFMVESHAEAVFDAGMIEGEGLGDFGDGELGIEKDKAVDIGAGVVRELDDFMDEHEIARIKGDRRR